MNILDVLKAVISGGASEAGSVIQALQANTPPARPSPQLQTASIAGRPLAPNPPTTIPNRAPAIQFNAAYPTSPGLRGVTPNIFTNNGVPYYQNPGKTLLGPSAQSGFKPASYPAIPLYSDIKPQPTLPMIGGNH